MSKEKSKVTNSQRVQKCLNENYKQYKFNVKKDKFAVWEKYAAEKGVSMRALLISLMDEAIERDGFVPEEKGEE